MTRQDPKGGLMNYGQSRSTAVMKELVSIMRGELSRATDDLTNKTAKYANAWERVRNAAKGTTGGGNNGGGGSLGLGMAGFSRPPSFGAVAAAGIGSALFSLAPDVNDAVAQRIAARSAGNLAGMTPQNMIRMTNALSSGGMTGSYSMQLAAANMLYQGGVVAGNTGFNNIMRQVGSLSAMTGISNEQTAGSFAAMNGMRGLQMGIRVRDNSGGIRPPSQIAADLYRRMYGSRKVSVQDVALVYNPGSRAYHNVMALAGGDQTVFQSIAAALVAQAKNNGAPAPLNNADKTMSLMGMDANDPMRNLMERTGTEAAKLQKTGNAQVLAYNASQDTIAAANKAFTALPGAVTNTIAALKSFQQALGGFSGTLGVLLGSLMYRGGGGGLTPGGAVGAKSFLKRGLGIGAVAAVGGSLLGSGAHPGSIRSTIGSALQYGGTGAMLGSFFGPMGAAIGGGLGALYGVTKSVITPYGDPMPGPQGGVNGNAAAMSMVAGGVGNVISKALSYVGRVPYVFGGKTAEGGWDCSGFVQTIYAKAGVSLPRTAAQQSRVGQTVNGLQNAKPGDLLFFVYGRLGKEVDHVGIYIGNGQMVEAANAKADTRVSNVNTRHLHSIKRVMGSSVGKSYRNLMDALKGRGVNILGSQGDELRTSVSNSSLSATTLSSITGLDNRGATVAGLISALSGNNSGSTLGSERHYARQTDDLADGSLTGVLRQAGFHGRGLRMAYAIAMAESGGRPSAYNDLGKDRSYGLFQINMKGKLGPDRRNTFGLSSNEDLWDALTNAKVAYVMSHGGTDWDAWSSYNSGAFKKFLNSYEKGAWKVTHDQTANIHKDEMVVPADTARKIRQGVVGSPNVTINLTVASASQEEAVRFAQRVKQIIQQDNFISEVGRS